MIPHPLVLLMIASGKTNKLVILLKKFANLISLSRPYTLDNGLANDCWNNVCGSDLKLPGTQFVLIILFHVRFSSSHVVCA